MTSPVGRSHARRRLGGIYRQRTLGTEAVYRVVARGVRDALIQVEVIRAPGLRPGSRLTFTGKAVAAMRSTDPRGR
jgi:hypothetical protein